MTHAHYTLRSVRFIFENVDRAGQLFHITLTPYLILQFGLHTVVDDLTDGMTTQVKLVGIKRTMRWCCKV